MTISLMLAQLKRRLEILHNRDYTWEEIAVGAGIHPNTMYKMAAGNARVHLQNVDRVVTYMRDEGLEISEPNDIFDLSPPLKEAS